MYGDRFLFLRHVRLECIPITPTGRHFPPRAMSEAKKEIPRIKAQLDNAWRAEKAGAPVIDGAAKAEDVLQNRVTAQATEDAERDQQALGEMSKKATGHATGPTSAPSRPEPAARRSSEESSSSRSRAAVAAAVRRLRSEAGLVTGDVVAHGAMRPAHHPSSGSAAVRRCRTTTQLGAPLAAIMSGSPTR